jgi:hypothetical protein
VYAQRQYEDTKISNVGFAYYTGKILSLQSCRSSAVIWLLNQEKTVFSPTWSSWESDDDIAIEKAAEACIDE